MNTRIRKANIVILFLIGIFMFVGGIMATENKPAYATDEDTVKVTGLKVEWDGNGGGNDLVIVTMDNANYTVVNENLNAHWEWYRPFIYVNGTQIESKDIAWGRASNYGVATDFCFFLRQDILKQDGTDIIEIKKGCHFPQTGETDYYAVSEDAKFFSRGEAGQSGNKEAFLVNYEWTPDVEIDVTDSVLKAQKASSIDGKKLQALSVKFRDVWGLKKWAGNTDSVKQGDLIKIEFTKPIDTTVIKSLKINYLYNDPNVLFDMYALDEAVINNSTLKYSFVSRGRGANQTAEIPTGIFADSQGKMSGFILQLKENGITKEEDESAVARQFFLDSVTPQTKEITPFVWESDKDYDASGDVFMKLPIKTIGEIKSPKVTVEDIEKYGWGITGFATFGASAIEEGQFIKFQLVNPIDVSQFKSVEITFMHNDDNAKFFVYPLSTEELIVDNAKQSFRTPKGAGKVTTLSTEALSENGLFRGFIIQLVNKNQGGQQFFLDSIKLKTEPYDTKLNITFTDGVESQKIDFNTVAQAPANNPVKENTKEFTYTFDDWYVGETKFDFNTKLTEDTLITAKFNSTKNKYNVTFLNEDGTAIGEPVTVEYGAKVTAPISPVKEGTEEYSYAFDGWYNGEVKFDLETVITDNIELKAKFTQTKNTFTVTYLNEDGTAIGDPVTVEYGAKATVPEIPVKENTEEFTYTFDGWYKGEVKFDFETVITENIELKAKFTQTKNTYTVTFLNEDGTAIGEPLTVEYGLKATAPISPVKENTKEFIYTFDGWYNGEVKFDFETVITGNIELKAKFISQDKLYKVTFSDGVNEVEVKYNGKVTKPEDPKKDGYKFIGWYNGETEFDFDSTITENINLTAKFEEEKGGCGGSINGVDIAVSTAILLMVAVVILRKKNQKN